MAPPKGDARRGRVWLFIIAAFVALCVLPVIFASLGNLLSPSSGNDAAPTKGPPAVDPGVAKAAFVKKISTLTDAMGSMNVNMSGMSMDATALIVETFNLGAQLVHDAADMALDKVETAKVQQMRDAVVQRQRQAFPLMRQKFGPIIAQKLWENDIEVKTKGGRFSTIEFVGGEFAANRNIAKSQEAIHPVLIRLRFKRAEYKWIRSAEEYTYYTIDSPDDDALAVVSGAGDVTLTVSKK